MLCIYEATSIQGLFSGECMQNTRGTRHNSSQCIMFDKLTFDLSVTLYKMGASAAVYRISRYQEEDSFSISLWTVMPL